jgi:hypothetical protein
MKKITPEESIKDLKARKHSVSQSTAAAMLKRYKAVRTILSDAKKCWLLGDTIPDLPITATFNKKAIIALTKLPGFTGLRISPGINADNMLTFILSGIDANGEVISPGNEMGKPGGTVTDEGQINPPFA